MDARERKQEIFLAKPQRAALRFPRGWDDVCSAELLALLGDPLSPQRAISSAVRIAEVRSGYELRGVSFRALCELPLRARTIRELVWLIGSGPAHSKEVLAETVAASPLHWLIGPGSPIEVRVSSLRSRLFHTGLIKAEIEEALRQQGVLVREDDPSAIPVVADLWRDNVTLGIGLGGSSLGKRGYKVDLRSPASIKEELAACCIDGFRRWMAETARPFTPEVIYVPYAGSGTFGVESLLAWGGLSPALFDRRYAMERLGVAPLKSIQHARKRLSAVGEVRLPRVLCVERDREQAMALRSNVEHVAAKCQGQAQISVTEADWFEVAPPAARGTRVFLPLNPPYGERLEVDEALQGEVMRAYERIGREVKRLREVGLEVAGLVLCPDGPARRSFLKGAGAQIHASRAVSHGGKKMEVLFFAGAT